MGKIINSITLKEYILLPTEEKEFYNELMKSVKPVEILRGKEDYKPIEYNFWNLLWEQIESLRVDISENNLESAILLIYKIDSEELIELSISNIVGCFKWIENKMLEIVEIETGQFEQSKPTQEQINAGIKNFEQYGFYNQLDELTKGDVLKEDEVMKQPYWKIFRKICRNRTKADYQEALMKQK